MEFSMFEVSILVWIQEHLRVPGLNGVMRLITTLGNGGIFWIVLTVLMLAFRKSRRTGIQCAVSMLLAMLVVNVTIKPLAARIRPYDLAEGLSILISRPHDFSFPSGHASNSLSCAWVMLRTLPKKYGVPAFVLAVLIALSRLYVGVHFPTDVLAGAAIGIALAEIAMLIFRKAEKALRKRKTAG